MPANTPKGYPYPVGTDRVADGDNAIADLASAVDTKLGVAAAGVVTFPGTVVNTTYTVVVTFPVGRFTVAPVVLANAISNVPASFLAATAFATAASVSVCGVRTTGTGAFNGSWFAVQI